MTALVKVARLHLVDRFSYTWLVWGVLAFTFVINLAIFAVVPLSQPSGNFTCALVTIYIFMIVIGVQAATRFLPFALTLGVSRRTYYLGTVLLVVTLCALYAAILTALWALWALWVVVGVGLVLLVTWRQWWPAVGSYLSELNVLAASGMLALVAAALAGGGYLTIRRITV
jgi:hypothetical protein